MANNVSDEALARYLTHAGVARSSDIEAARKAQTHAAEKGVSLSLADALVRQGIITPRQREDIEKRLQAQQAGGITQLGQYKLLSKIGEGGMGTVYLAEDTVVGRQVAIKVLLKKYADDRVFLTRFRREAQTTGKLNHVNIVMAYAVGEDVGHHYYVMEYCEGEILEKILKREQILTWEKATAIVLQVARGLKHAHEHGIIHRDIKPANIFICKPLGSDNTTAGLRRKDILAEGFVAKILDLGLSKHIGAGEQSSFYTQTGVALGTPHYLSPEQARGDKDIDGRTDIYSLGATFYHTVTGETPFHGSTAAIIMMKHLTEQLPNPQDIREDIPDGVVHVIQRMMAKDPADRYRDCKELLEDLELVIDGKMPASEAIDGHKTSVSFRLRAPMPRAPEGRREPRGPGAPGQHGARASIPRPRGGPASSEGERAPEPAGRFAARQHKARPAEGEVELVPLTPLPNRKPIYAAAGVVALGVLLLVTALLIKGRARQTEHRPEGAPAPSGLAVAPSPATAAKGAPDKEGAEETAKAPEAARKEPQDVAAATATKPPAQPAPEAKAPLPRAPAATQSAQPAIPDPQSGIAVDAPERWKNALNLLPLIDVQKDAVSGKWEFKNGALVSAGGQHERIEVPYRASDEYDCRAVFTRAVGAEVMQTLVHASKPCTWHIGGYDDTLLGFQFDGSRAEKARLAMPEYLKDGQRHSAVIQVRSTGVTAFIDGKRICEWRPGGNLPGVYSSWRQRDETLLGLGTHRSSATFHSVDVLEIAGKGVFARPNEPSAIEAERQRSTGAGQAAGVPAQSATTKTETVAGLTGSAGQELYTQPGLCASWYECKEGMKAALLSDTTPNPLGTRTVENLNLPDKSKLLEFFGRAEMVAVRLWGYIEIPRDDTYTFYLNSDDGSILEIGDKLLIDNDDKHAFVEKAGTVVLKAGRYPFRVRYYQGTNTAGLVVSWAAPGVAKQVVPTSAFSRNDPEAARQAAERAAKLGYEQALSEAYALLNSNDAKGALARLEQAKGDAKLAALKPALDRDLECAGYFEDLNKAVAAGAALLADNKRAFTLSKSDGKEMPTGQGTKNTVAGVRDECIAIDQDLGGAKATAKWKLAELSAQTRLELARLGMPPGGEGQLKLAFAGILMLQAGSKGTTAKQVRAHLDAAGKEQVPQERIAHLQERLEVCEGEVAAEGTIKKIEAAYKAKRWKETCDLIENLRKDSPDTLVLYRSRPAIEKWWDEADAQVNPLRIPGSPADEAWCAAAQKLPSGEQLSAVLKKLKELNPKYDGREIHKLEGGKITEFSIGCAELVKDIGPLGALDALRKLDLTCTPSGGKSSISDLTPLKGLPLTWLRLSNVVVTDLSPLRGLRLASFYCDSSGAQDLSPLKGMPLTVLDCRSTAVKDLSPVRDAPLVELSFQADIAFANLALLRGIRTLEKINGKPAADFLKDFGAGAGDVGAKTPATPQGPGASVAAAKPAKGWRPFPGLPEVLLYDNFEAATLFTGGKLGTEEAPVQDPHTLRLGPASGDNKDKWVRAQLDLTRIDAKLPGVLDPKQVYIQFSLWVEESGVLNLKFKGAKGDPEDNVTTLKLKAWQPLTFKLGELRQKNARLEATDVCTSLEIGYKPRAAKQLPVVYISDFIVTYGARPETVLPQAMAAARKAAGTEPGR